MSAAKQREMVELVKKPADLEWCIVDKTTGDTCCMRKIDESMSQRKFLQAVVGACHSCGERIKFYKSLKIQSY